MFIELCGLFRNLDIFKLIVQFEIKAALVRGERNQPGAE